MYGEENPDKKRDEIKKTSAEALKVTVFVTQRRQQAFESSELFLV